MKTYKEWTEQELKIKKLEEQVSSLNALLSMESDNVNHYRVKYIEESTKLQTLRDILTQSKESKES